MTNQPSNTQTNEQTPIGYTYKCPCGRAPTRLFAEKYLAHRAIKGHKKRNHGQTGCRRLKVDMIPVMPPEVA